METEKSSQESAMNFPFPLFELIPCCQHVTDSYKTEFESFINSEVRQHLRQEQETQFLLFLLLHPRNQAFLRNVAVKGICCQQNNLVAPLDSVEEARFDEVVLQLQLNAEKMRDYLISSGFLSLSTSSQSIVTWERLLILMRNIVTHEYRFDWLWTLELASYAESYFISWTNFQKITSSYAQLVMGTQEIKSLNYNEDSELCGLLSLFSGLIPRRSLNAIVDDHFCDEMDEIYSAQDAEQDLISWNSRWETFAQWLKHHPANFEQVGSNIQSYSWFVVVRLMRNIFCHEADFGWTGLQELAIQAERFFGSLKGFEQLLKVYEKHCSARFTNSIDIQLYQPANCLFFFDDENAAFYVGVEHPAFKKLKYDVSKAVTTFKDSNLQLEIRVSGSKKSGRTFLVQKVLPCLLNEFKSSNTIIQFHENDSDIANKRQKLFSDESNRVDIDFDADDLVRTPCAKELADLQLLMRHVMGADKYLLKELLLRVGLDGSYLPVDPTRAVIHVSNPITQRLLSPSIIVSIYKRLLEKVRLLEPNLEFLINQKMRPPLMNSTAWIRARNMLHHLIDTCIREIEIEII